MPKPSNTCKPRFACSPARRLPGPIWRRRSSMREKPHWPASSSARRSNWNPRNFDANHNLGEFYIQSGKIAEACPLLEEAQRINPSSYDNGYDLALAYFLTARLADARKAGAEHLCQPRTPASCITCSARSKRKTKNSSPRSTSLRPPLTWTPARTTSSIGEASCFSTEPMNRPSKSSRKRPGVIRIRPG
jgi:hypothetical protein